MLSRKYRQNVPKYLVFVELLFVRSSAQEVLVFSTGKLHFIYITRLQFLMNFFETETNNAVEPCL